MNSTVQVCISCNTALAIGLKLHFCPFCGTAQLEKKLLAGKSTQNYDPSNPQHKPWREKSRLPQRNYTYGEAKHPWCPPMRQMQKRPTKSRLVKYDPNVVDPSLMESATDPEIGDSEQAVDEVVTAERALSAHEEQISPALECE